MRDSTEKLFQHLIRLCNELSKGRDAKANDIFELTKIGKYPELVTELAEAFGMMIVKVESREFRLEQIIENLEQARAELSAAKERLASENLALKRDLRDKFSPSVFIGTSARMKEILRMVERLADTDINVLLTGETGTGKGMIAKTIHYNSRRSEKPFVGINCSAIPESIFESEMFGIESGVATGVTMRKGRIEEASGGTLFLDEIADMPLNHQVKMLRVIEEGEVERLGGRKPIPIDVRFIAATNKELKDEIEKKNFRKDLFYRLNVINLLVPPLRERKEDIPPLLNLFIGQSSRKLAKPQVRFSAEALDMVMKYDWPGNVRELENEVERAVALSVGETVVPDDLSDSLRKPSGACEHEGHPSTLIRETELDLINKVLADTGGNKSEAARKLGLSREGLRKKLRRYSIK